MDVMNVDENMDDKKKARVSIGAMLSVMEIVIAIGIFAIISTFLLRFFTVANRLSDEAREVSKASITAEAIFEHIRGSGFIETVEELGFTMAEEKAMATFNEKFDVLKDGRDGVPYFNVEISKTMSQVKAGVLSSYNIKVTRIKNNRLLFDFNGKSYEKVVGDEKQ